MKVALLDDYEHTFEKSPAIKGLRQKVEVRIFSERFSSKEALAPALNGCQTIVAIRERTRFPGSLLSRAARS